MDTQRSSLLTWAYYCQGKSMDDLRHSLLLTSLELEQTRQAVQEELRKRDDQLNHVKDLLSKTMMERDEAQDKFQRLLLEKLLLQQQQHQNNQQQQQQHNDPLSGVSSIEDEQQQPKRGMDSNNGFSSSDCEESIVSSPVTDQNPLQFTPPQPPSMAEEVMKMVPEKPLPEKGKLLQAVMKAGPLLQTLLLAGPLPQWRHPPPPLESFEIPPVTIPSPPPPPPPLSLPPPHINQDTLIINRKRSAHFDASASPTETSKYQRVALR